MSCQNPLTSPLAHYFKKRIGYKDWTYGKKLIIPKYKKQPNWRRLIDEN